MKTLYAVLLLGVLATSAVAQPTPVSLPSPAPAPGQETVGELVVEGRWG